MPGMHQILHLVFWPFRSRSFSATYASNPGLIEWKEALSYFKRSLADEWLIMNLAVKIAKF
jgi:hypothetical protein